MSKVYTDDERVQIAKKEYDDLNVNDPITINNGKTIGYVSKVIDKKDTGEQAFVITDGDPRIQKPKEVKNVTILYQGSMGLDKTLKHPGKVKKDWWDNNKPLAGNVLKGLEDPAATFEPTQQMKSTGKSLNKLMDTYINATFDVYGHSQASSNVQYGLGTLDSQDKIDRINGAFVYQGPNAYSMLTKEQRKTVEQLKDRIFNFVDEKDAVPIGYRLPEIGQTNPFHVGTLIFVDSKKASLSKQHMWGGYDFKEGNLKVTKESLVAFQEAKQKYNERVMREQVKNLEQLEKKLTASGGGLSSSERIYLDDSQALAVVSNASSTFETAMMSVVMVYQKGIKEAEELWLDILSDARSIGTDLREDEIRYALARGGATKQIIVDEPVKAYQDKIKKAKQMSQDFRKLAQEIRSKIKELVERDKELANQLKGLVS